MYALCQEGHETKKNGKLDMQISSQWRPCWERKGLAFPLAGITKFNFTADMKLVQFCSTRPLRSRIRANVSDSFLAPLLALHESVDSNDNNNQT